MPSVNRSSEDPGRLCSLQVTALSPWIIPGDIEHNLKVIADCLKKYGGANTVCVFPELSITGATLGEFFRYKHIQKAAYEGLKRLLPLCEGIVAVGLPVVIKKRLIDALAIIEKHEVRVFVTRRDLSADDAIHSAYYFDKPDGLPKFEYFDGLGEVALSPRISHMSGSVSYSFALGNEFVGPSPESDVVVYCHSYPQLAGSAEMLRQKAIKSSEEKRLCCTLGLSMGETGSDFVFGSHCTLAFNGSLLEESAPFKKLNNEPALVQFKKRTRLPRRHPYSTAPKEQASRRDSGHYARNPYFEGVDGKPLSPTQENKLCRDILQIQANALALRLKKIGSKRPILGISGGLDSTLALLAAVGAQDALGRSRSDVLAVTMPGFGTSDRTYTNACALVKALGATLLEIPIADSVRQHFVDIGQDPNKHDVTYENAQARERTQILMDLANKEGGIVLGTGDLSEIALGWCTYNGDHMANFGVNASLTKTMIRKVCRYQARYIKGEAKEILRDIVNTPVSPELLPAQEGNIAQKTENILGPYELHDFFIWHVVKEKVEPQEVYRRAYIAFKGIYTKELIKQTLYTFYQRFITQQYKRSCSPEGVAVSPVSLSPRGSWIVPSDISAEPWLRELNMLE